MRVDLLGPIRVHDDSGAPIAVPPGRQRALLTRLAIDPGLVSAPTLIDALWPAAPPANASGALQTQVSRLRRLVGDRLRSDSGGYRLTDVTTDAAEFERLAAGAETARSAATVRSLCDRALALWRGPALSDVAELPFAGAEITRLTARREAVAARLIEARLELEGAEPVLAELAARNAADPLSEPDAARYMRALAATGRRAEALAVYDKVRSQLADELGVDPSPALAEAHLDVLRGVQAAPSEASRLPRPLTACIGREDELDAVLSLIARGRLVTLTGPGGTGKTRLAIEAAHRVERGGVFVRLIELAPVSDSGRLADVFLDALRGGPVVPRRAVQAGDRLAEILRSRETLLVVDNCEHLIDAVAELAADLLTRVPGLRMLATSRESLGITGEAVYGLGPLSLPDPAEAPADLASDPAVRLFVERGRQSDPSFDLTDANAATVARVCASLDGLPLAIELAAARLRSMSLEDLAERLDDRFSLLVRGDRTAAPRQRTLRGVVDWSWDLLEEDERRLLARMSVFNGTADLDAVTEICSASVDLVSGLVDKSLVQLIPGGRYRLLETVREYAAERLAEFGETAERYAAHAVYFAEVARRAEDHLMSAEQIEWLERLARDHGNLTAAIRRMIAAGNSAVAHRCIAPLAWYWWMRGHRKEGQELTFLVRRMEGKADPLDRAKVGMSGTWGLWSGDLDPADIAVSWESTRRIADEHGLWETAPILKMVPALLALVNGEEGRLRRIGAQLGDGDDPRVRGFVVFFCAGFSERNGDQERAAAELAECNAIFESIGERFGIILSLQGLASVREAEGDYAEARRLLARALDAESEFGAATAESVVIESLWRLDAEHGDDPAAVLARMRLEAERAVRAGNGENAMSARTAAATCLRRLGRLTEARDLLLAAEAERPKYVEYSETSLRLYKQLAVVAADLGDRDLERRAAEIGRGGKWPFSW